MSHSLIVRMHPHNLSKVGSGKSITLTPDDLDNGEHVVRLIFTEKKHATKLLNNHSKIKATRINPEHIEDAELHQVHGGRSFWSSLRDVGSKIVDVGRKVVESPITKSVVKAATPIVKDFVKQGVADAVGSRTNPIVGQLAGQVASNAVGSASDNYTGSGVRRLYKYPYGGSFAPLGSGIQELQSGTSLGGHNVALRAINPTSMQERMAHVRSFRRKA